MIKVVAVADPVTAAPNDLDLLVDAQERALVEPRRPNKEPLGWRSRTTPDARCVLAGSPPSEGMPANARRDAACGPFAGGAMSTGTRPTAPANLELVRTIYAAWGR